MKALITGASSGIGKDMTYVLEKMGHKVFAVARNKSMLEENFKELKNVEIISMDLSIKENCFKLYEMLKFEEIDILINNAGVGFLGEFMDINLEDELKMIDLNINTPHILMKLFLKDMLKRDKGYILNVASIGGFFAGPLVSSYYATKSYLLNLTLAINEEIRVKKSKVYVGAFCPPTVNTNFHKLAGAKRTKIGIDSYAISKYAINKMFKQRILIIPIVVKTAPFIMNILPKRISLKILYFIQKSKI